MNFNDMIKEEVESITRSTKNIDNIMKAQRLLQGVNLDCVEYAGIYVYSNTLCIDLNLKEESKDAKLHFAIKRANPAFAEWKKEQNYNGSALEYVSKAVKGETEVTLTIRGAIPATCHLEDVEEPLSDWEIKQAEDDLKWIQKKLSSGKRIVKKVVCKE